MLIGLAGACIFAAERPVEERKVEDLAYGEILFEFYQEDYFAALVRLLAAQARNEFSAHAEEAELLSGGLYLSYGQHRAAGEIFNAVLEGSVDPSVHDRAWYFLANIWHQRGYLDQSAAALNRISGALPPELELERRMLHAQVSMEQGRFADALTHLEAWPDKHAQSIAYAKYNIGVALVRLGRVAEGARVLQEIGELKTKDDTDFYALRDKANVALGYAWLQADVPVEAKTALQRVRLDGPFSSMALLGVGWADAEQSDYRAALAPWVELRKRDMFDSAVQESLLAVPYAYARLGANGQAADFYGNAIESFTGEIGRIDAAIRAIQNGELLDTLLDHGKTDGSGWYWRLEDVPDTDESRYLYELMSTHRFQEALKNYRDLVFLRQNLEGWKRSLTAFEDILATKETAYRERLPVIDASLAAVDTSALSARRVELESRLSAIERNEDFVSLGTADEQRAYHELDAMEAKLAMLGDDEAAEQLRHKQRLLKGLVTWDLGKSYKFRLWQQHRELDALTREIRSAERLETRVRNASRDWPKQFGGQSGRVATLGQRVAVLTDRTRDGIANQQAYLQNIAVEELLAKRQRLGTYLVQAQFSLAAIYDRAALNVPGGTGSGPQGTAGSTQQ